MGYLIGTDEAGYGPNLGPLVISATVWEVPEEVGSADLYRRLSAAIAPAAERNGGANGGGRVVMADSKALYHSGGGLRMLERGLWAAFALLGRRPQSAAEVWDLLAPGDGADGGPEAGYCGDELPLPLDAAAGELDAVGGRLQAAFAAAGVRLLGVRSRAIFPGQFNDMLQKCRSKGLLLSRATLAMVAALVESLPGGPVAVLCDKHGGRDRYLPLLMECFPEPLIEIHGQSRRQSVYRFGPAQRRVEIRFQAKAEAHLPAALASMAAKYLRELAMRALNDFWRRRVPGLAPTAGYPQDAVRFKGQIAAVQSELGIDDHLLWRTK
jgi:ribonuclease HII